MTQPFRWGLLGAGEVARNFGRSVSAQPGHAVTTVASRNMARATSLARELGRTCSATSYTELVADPSIDAVYVATPASLHREHVALALKSGKPVLCEKPFAVSASEARELIELARESGTFCMEAMWMRFIPAMRALKARIDAGEIGEVRSIRAELGFPVAYDPAGRHFDPSLGGGSVLDLGVYLLSLAWYLLGRPVEGQMLSGSAPTGVDARAAIQLRFESGAIASLACGFDQRLRNDCLVTGSRGSIAVGAPLFSPERLVRIKASPPAREAVADGGPREAWPSGITRRHPTLVSLRRRFAPLLRQIVRGERSTRAYRFSGYGYQFEAEEVARCVRSQLLESPTMPLSESLEVMECIDRLRRDGHFS